MKSQRWALLALALLLLYVGFFFSFELSTSPVVPDLGRRLTRLDILLASPELLFSVVVPDDPNQSPLYTLGWLADRVPLVAVAALLALAALGYGKLGLRLLGLQGVLSRPERLFFAYGIGTSWLSLVTLAAGLAGFLNRPLLLGFAVFGPLVEGVLLIRSAVRRDQKPDDKGIRSVASEVGTSRVVPVSLYALALAPFVLVMLLGAMLPPMEFDVREYHLQGPKEFYQQGRIAFLPHNVYANMPFGTEMLSLLAMVILDDWWRGALAGKTLLSFFPLVSALGLWSAGTRFFNPAAGALAALIYLSTPWTCQLATIAFVEGGMAFFLFAAVYGVVLACRQERDEKKTVADGNRFVLLAGLMAGSAAACKYPGVVFVVVPLLLTVVMVSATTKRAGGLGPPVRGAALFVLGVGLTFGPWLVKNAVLAGNPTYPLLSSVFTGRTWTEAKAERWMRIHTSSTFTLEELGAKLLDVTTRTGLQSPLVFGLIPFALLGSTKGPWRRGLFGYLVFVTAVWWLFTHRIDRFWVPVLPVAALLAGAGATWTRADVWRWGRGAIFFVALVYNLALCTVSLDSRYTLSLERARVDPDRVKPAILAVNRELPAEAKILVVGEAAVFDFERPVFYNTVFDDVLLETWTRGKTADETRRNLKQHGITHVYVDWNEIARYRSPGNYGYSDYVTRDVFRRLVEAHVLKPPRSVGPAQEWYEVWFSGDR